MKKLLLQIFKFLGFSGIGWILDFVIYTVLGAFSGNLVLNNIISSFAGVTFVFIFSAKTIFKNESKVPLKVKYIIYILYQCILIYFISKVLGALDIWLLNNVSVSLIQKFSSIISKILVTPITMVMNFIVMKNVIERI